MRRSTHYSHHHRPIHSSDKNHQSFSLLNPREKDKYQKYEVLSHMELQSLCYMFLIVNQYMLFEPVLEKNNHLLS